ncbi:MAG: DUF4173 domain-containing protein [Mobilitalea sp.]
MEDHNEKVASPLLKQFRENFGIFGGISLLFGIGFAILFYKAGAGLNTLLITLLILCLLFLGCRKLSLTVKKGTKFYFLGAFLLAVSTVLTSSGTLQFLNIIAILILLDLSMLHQFYESREWDFLKHFLKMLGMPFRAIGSIGLPFIDFTAFLQKTSVFKNDKVRNVFLGVLISIPFLWMVTALLANADMVFSKLTNQILDVFVSTDIIGVLLMVFAGFLICYCVFAAAVSNVGLEEKRFWKKAEASIAATVLLVLTIVYALFCGIQIIYLFAKGVFELPEGFTYAEYARQGFFELLFVAMLNVALIVICRALFENSKVLQIVKICMTVCTYVLIISATCRMLLYISAYHLTFLRMFVLLSLFIVTLILTGVLISEFRPAFPLFQYFVVVIAVCYTAFSFSKPDYIIASYRLEQEELDQEDLFYLTHDLSLDAAPLVLPVAKNTYDYINKIENVTKNMEVRDFNLSSYLANQELKKYK